MIAAGRRRKLVTIEEPVEGAQDAFGQPAVTWQTVTKAWAAVEPFSGSERFTAGQVQAEVTHRVTILYRTGITPRCRIVLGDRTLQIAAVVNRQERDRELELLCTEAITA
jgi:SPP1 family predicted phage head-tail adaptor